MRERDRARDREEEGRGRGKRKEGRETNKKKRKEILESQKEKKRRDESEIALLSPFYFSPLGLQQSNKKPCTPGLFSEADFSSSYGNTFRIY